MGRTKTIETTEINIENKMNEDTIETTKTEEIDYVKIIEEMKSQIESLKSQTTQPQVIIQQDVGMSGRRVKCINLMNCALNVSTESNGKGKTYTFENYGDWKSIKFDDVEAIVSSYPYTMQNGLLYIADKEVVEKLELTEEYSKLYTKEKIDKIIYLREESDVDFLLGMEENLQETTLNRIALLLNENETFNYNFLRRIKNETGFDIEATAQRWKISDPNIAPEDKEKMM